VVQPAESTQPPKQGHWVRGHWTPYEPPDPAAFPEGTKVHTIVPGDTLWDLAATYLGDPWLWPQIWDENRYVLDSHWIYPGDPLIVPAPPTVVGETRAAPPAPEGPTDVQPILSSPQQVAPPAEAQAGPQVMGPELKPVADEEDLYCSEYISTDAPPTLIVAEREENAKAKLSTGDVVYLNGGMSQSVLPGQQYSILRTGRIVTHPLTGEEMGTIMHQLGRLKVIASQEQTATAMIEMSCTDISVGDWLEPFAEIAVPLSAGVPFERYGLQFEETSTGYVVHTADDLRSVGAGNTVEIDLGSNEGLAPGDHLTIYRNYYREKGFYSTESYIDVTHPEESLATAGEFPPVVLGQLVVLRVADRHSTAKIIRSVTEITIGDRVAKH
jgi:LysM domain-containing protein